METTTPAPPANYALAMNEAQAHIFADIVSERCRQETKWGPQEHPNGTEPSWINRQNADKAKALTDAKAKNGRLTWWDIFAEEAAEARAERDHYLLRAELIQTLAVGVAWIEDMDRKHVHVAVSMGEPNV